MLRHIVKIALRHSGSFIPVTRTPLKCLGKKAGFEGPKPALPLCPLVMKQLWRRVFIKATVKNACLPGSVFWVQERVVWK